MTHNSSVYGVSPNQSEPVVITNETHEAVHDGTAYDEQIEISGLGKGASTDIYITTGANFLFVQDIRLYAGEGDIRISLYEDVTVSAPGAAELEPVCRNRDLRSTPTTVFYQNPTITDIGTSIAEQWLPPTQAGTGAEGFRIAIGSDQWLMDNNTAYVIRLLNRSKQSVDLFFDMAWVEGVTY